MFSSIILIIRTESPRRSDRCPIVDVAIWPPFSLKFAKVIRTCTNRNSSDRRDISCLVCWACQTPCLWPALWTGRLGEPGAGPKLRMHFYKGSGNSVLPSTTSFVKDVESFICCFAYLRASNIIMITCTGSTAGAWRMWL
jgi:hypothetical protein